MKNFGQLWLFGFGCCLISVGIRSYNTTDETQKIKSAGTEASYFEPAELATIRTAAIRNGIEPGSPNWYRLLGIRKAEAGKPGLEFGIMNPKANDLDSQAGWCAASIVKSEMRWIRAGQPGDFIDFMGARYCPPADHPLNKNWAGNVRHWVVKLGGAK